MTESHDHAAGEFDAGDLDDVQDDPSLGGIATGGIDADDGAVDPGLYERAAAAWTDNVAGCSCAITATDPTWTDQLYTQILENPTQPVVWTNAAPDPGWTTVSDVAADPNTVVTYPTTTSVIGGPQDAVAPVVDDPQLTTSVIGGPQDSVAPVVEDPQFTTSVIGGPQDSITYAPPDGSQFTAVIGGPQSSDSLNSSLQSMYGVAVNNNDLMSQLILQNIMSTQNHISDIWAMPDVVVL